jgi:hypothetical protein
MKDSVLVRSRRGSHCCELPATAFAAEAQGRSTVRRNGLAVSDLRRTARTGLSKLGVAPHIAERCLDHVSGRSTVERIYDGQSV